MVLFLYLIAGALIVVFFLCRDDVSPGQAQKLPENAIRLRKGIGGFIEVVGESRFQEVCQRARAAAWPVGTSVEFWAGLEPEPTNPADSEAVRIHFDGHTLGYLTRAEARIFRQTHVEAISSGRPIFCLARPIGGSKDKPTIGIMLDFLLQEEKRLKQGYDSPPTKVKKPSKSK